jgi:cysteine-rich repeat protein
MSLIVNSGPTGGNCQTFHDGIVNVRSLRAFEEVEISCSSFSDPDLPITYEHSYLVGETFFEYYRGYKSVSKTPVLPGGKFIWKVQVFDKFGASSSPITGQISVLPSSASITKEVLTAVHSKNIGVALACVLYSSFVIDTETNVTEGRRNSDFATQREESASRSELCASCRCEECDSFRMAIDLVGSMSLQFSMDQVLKSLSAFNLALSSTKLRNALNSTNSLATVDCIALLFETLLVNSRMTSLKYQDISLISASLSSISASVTDQVLTLAFNKTMVLYGLVLPQFIHAFSASLLPRLDDTYILNSRIKIVVSRRFQSGEQLIVASSALNALPRVLIHANASSALDGSAIAVLLSYGIVSKVSTILGTFYTAVVDFSVYRSVTSSNTTILIEFPIDEIMIQILSSDKFLSNDILRMKSKVQSWDFSERRWMQRPFCVVIEANLNETRSVTARCSLSSGSPTAISFDPEQSICSDGYITGAESCDDGNLIDGDGCSSDCGVERGWKCQFGPSKCEILSE